MDKPIHPKVFISYSWTGDEYISRVCNLVDSLIKSGVEVVFDQYDLEEGADLNSYMERAVRDESITKVLILCDARYQEKADGRNGGVGTEALIMSQEVYNQLNPSGTNQRYIPVVMEKDAEGKPSLPIYLASRKYIDLSPGSAGGFDQLLRYLHGCPLRQRPELGIVPSHILRETQISLGTTLVHTEALQALKSGATSAKMLCEDFFELFAANLSTFRLEDYDQGKIIKYINEFLPARNEYVDVLVGLIKSERIEDMLPAIKRFFEKLYLYTEPTDNQSSWREADFDHFKFLTNECFLYTISALLRYENFSLVPEFLSDFYVPPKSRRSGELVPYTAFYFHLSSLEAENNEKQLRRHDLQADFLYKNATRHDIDFNNIMQGDFFLYLYCKLHTIHTYGLGWYPRTLLYAGYMTGPFEIFARATFSKYFDKLKNALNVKSVSELRSLRILFSQEHERLNSRREARDFIAMANLDKLASTP